LLVFHFSNLAVINDSHQQTNLTLSNKKAEAKSFGLKVPGTGIEPAHLVGGRF
jgi:hypothetical protein